MSDEWKEEDEETPFGWNVFGCSMTPKQRAAAADRLAQQTAIGNLAYESLRFFDPDRVCPKCASDKRAKVLHVKGPGGYADQIGDHEALLRTCKRCCYEWLERTADAGPN